MVTFVLIPNPERFWKCPTCGFRISEQEHLYSLIDITCPQCNTFKYSGFVPDYYIKEKE